MDYKARLDKLLDQGILSEEEHKRGMEADKIKFEDLTWEYPEHKN